jgi:hypothetical protein
VLRTPVTWTQHDAPAAQPLAHWSTEAGRLTLGLAGLGSLRVSREVVEVLAPDEASRARIWVRLGEWATAQWAALHGYFVVRGAVVARDGRAFAITGGVRCGASLVALVLARRGWGLVSDGLVIIDTDLTARALSPEITVDPAPVSGLPADLIEPVVQAGRPRVRVAVTGHPDAPVSGTVLLTRSFQARGLTVVCPADLDEAVTALHSLAIHCALTESGPVSPPRLPWWRAHRPQAPTTPGEASVSSPVAIAAALDPLLSAAGATR